MVGVVLWTALLFGGICAQEVIPEAPVIGIVTQDKYYGPGVNGTYIAASYVKALESSGARVVPVHYNMPLNILTTLFNQLDGLLFPGGAMYLNDFSTPYMVSTLHLWKLALNASLSGRPIPVWGTCLGFEFLSVAAANDPTVLEDGFDSNNIVNSINFTPSARASELFSRMDTELFDALGNELITVNFHQFGVPPAAYKTNKNLDSIFEVLGTNRDLKGREYVSVIQGKGHPFYAVQFHPEKNCFEWSNTQVIPHTPHAIEACQYFHNFFVNKCRNGKPRMDYKKLMNLVIWNNPVSYTFPESNFMQTYFFTDADVSKFISELLK